MFSIVHTIVFVSFCDSLLNVPSSPKNAEYTLGHAHNTVVTSVLLKSSVFAAYSETPSRHFLKYAISVVENAVFKVWTEHKTGE